MKVFSKEMFNVTIIEVGSLALMAFALYLFFGSLLFTNILILFVSVCALGFFAYMSFKKAKDIISKNSTIISVN